MLTITNFEPHLEDKWRTLLVDVRIERSGEIWEADYGIITSGDDPHARLQFEIFGMKQSPPMIGRSGIRNNGSYRRR